MLDDWSDPRLVHLWEEYRQRNWERLNELIAASLRGGNTSDGFAAHLAFLMSTERPKGPPPAYNFTFACCAAECRDERLAAEPDKKVKMDAVFIEAYHRLVCEPGFDPTPDAEKKLTKTDRERIAAARKRHSAARSLIERRNGIRQVSPGIVKRAWYQHRETLGPSGSLK